MELTKLKMLRTERGFTLRKLAERADVDLSTISMLENGRKRSQIITLVKLAKALNVPVDDLLQEHLDTSAPSRGRKGWQAKLDRKMLKEQESAGAIPSTEGMAAALKAFEEPGKDYSQEEVEREFASLIASYKEKASV